MARHAGFAVAVSLREAYLNQTLWAAIADQEPISANQMFALPSSVPVPGAGTARLSGLALFEQRPTMTMKANPGNTVAMTASAIVFVAANTDIAAPIDTDQTYKVRISANVNVAVDVDVASDGLYLRWKPGGSSVGNLAVQLLEGPNVPQFLIDALNSPATVAAMNAALSALGPIRISDRLFPRRLQKVQTASFPSTGVSLFDWFTITADISRVGLRVMDGSIALGIDFAGMSAGNDNALVDLNQQVGDGPVYRCPIFDNTSGMPVIVPGGAQPDKGDICVLLNADVLGAIVGSVSSQISGTQVAPKVRIVSVLARPQQFDKPLRGREMGLCVEFKVNHQDAGDIVGRIFLQPYLSYDASNNPNPRTDSWLLYIGKVEIDVPWWVDIAVVVAGLALAVMLPAASPLIAIGVIAAIDGIIPGAISNGEASGQAALGRGKDLALGMHNGHLPTHKQQPTYTGVTRVQVNSDGIGVCMATVAPDLRFGTGDATVDVASLTTDVNAGSPAPFVFSLALRPDLASLAPECSVQLIVFRNDTGAEIGRAEGPYNASRTVTINHMTPDLYHVDDYFVQARIFLNRVSLTGLLFAANRSVKVVDPLDRHKPFVFWDPHVAYFRSPQDPTRFWARLNHPSVHRTAASSRCLAVRQRITRLAGGHFGLGVSYSDNLGFDFSEVPARRKDLCDYCFFGGPTRTTPFPQEDWFTR